MGLFDSSSEKDSNNTSTINSSEIDDSLKNLITVTNDVTSSSVLNLMNWTQKFMEHEFPDFKISQFLDILPSAINDSELFNGWRDRYKSQKNSYGYWAYPTPSDKLYKSCKEKEGLSAWDSKGYWRCLFPKALIPAEYADSTLSKEDVQNDTNHEKGLFFENYTDYLDFKVKMKEQLRIQREEEWNKFKEQQKSKWDFLASKNSDSTDNSTTSFNDVAGKKVTGTSSSTSIRTLENGDVEKNTILQQYFEDGSSERKSVKEILKANGERKVLDENVANITPDGNNKSGWFWN
ncbi:hypothetical protein CANARDRAFT_195969 [[Candida] arabinofermentans NRRL YB-2248]|uniref:Mitochondrial peculiar membrane protein 1 n=1 Tax=[Candida] arabinofermentans NRRL YB-2248 TaxID=983967 RepID=A0A1E4T4V5_9ASCO|nr:hypothetical protein CANARDRAFT_195969 [[Candida] arabinofermentans NRRL YB-2248]